MFAFMRQTVCPQRRQTNTTTQTHIDVPEPKAEQTPRSNVYKSHSNVSGDASSSTHKLLSSSNRNLNDTITAMCRTLHDRLQCLPAIRMKFADLLGALQVLTPDELRELRILKGRMVYRGDRVYEVTWTHRNVSAAPFKTREQRLRQLSRRTLWRRVIHRVVTLLQQRQAWSVMGRRLQATAGLFRHVRRTNGRLHFDFYGLRHRGGYH
jgi:hypothetical protein